VRMAFDKDNLNRACWEDANGIQPCSAMTSRAIARSCQLGVQAHLIPTGTW